MKYSNLPFVFSGKLFSAHILSLISGTLIYLLFRTSSLRVFSWLDFFGISFINNKFRIKALSVNGNFPEWFLFSVPDGLWIFSYICLMLFIWKSEITFKNMLWISIIPLIAIGSEVSQIFGWVSGTFDFYDVIFYILGSILPFLFFNKSIQYNF